ncbi:FAD-dependent oxidoreductase [Altererythrobacter lutimaris]|uniref:FAD-dependent oxidoreductase n=1 Tax=Altererythrobacter lutimaris TaxID=2743979 RepID=A0A850H9E2_9SPHN|nr:FAD-dependent oxidoreductase [Altererythrobacter lutimaris]NVE93506.1 FAD-dependent oxidoreductase [Altererythrobacter lutimaris]
MNEKRSPDGYDLLLIGGGHAQLAVIKDWIDNGVPAERVALTDPASHARYSGTVPGIISGQHDLEHGQVDLAKLCELAGIERIEDRVVAIDPDVRHVTLGSGEQVRFDIASIDTGGVGQAERILGPSDKLIDVRPIHDFIETSRDLAERHRGKQLHVAVVGGGAGGVELALAIRNAKGIEPAPQVVLIAGKAGLLPELGSWVRGLAERELERQGIPLIEADAQFRNGALTVQGQALEPIDAVIAAVGSGAPQWPGEGGLATDSSGFIAVDAYQRSTSHPHVFASGDVAQRMDRRVPHAGVHAVHTGPALAANLRALAGGEGPSETYTPRPASLYLLSTGTGEAIMSYGWLGGQGAWAQRWKEAIDKRWLDQYG